MSECGVCISGFDPDGNVEFSNTTWPVARKEHRCDECRKIISKGTKYRRDVGKYDGELFTEINCSICVEIREAFTCWEEGHAYVPGDLWADMQSAVFPGLTSACFDRLKTPEAKAELRRRWMEWKGLAA